MEGLFGHSTAERKQMKEALKNDLRYARYINNQYDIRLEFKNDEVCILPINNSDCYAETRIKNLDRIYNLESRWSSELDGSFVSISERVGKEAEDRKDLLSDDNRFITEIERIALDFGHNKGKAFLIAQYIKWLSQNKNASKAARISSISSISELKKALK